MSDKTSEAFLNLGVPGAALFIVLVIVVFMFKQQSTSIDKLCTKIDELVTNLADNSLKLNETIVANSREQQEVIHKLDSICKDISDMHKRITRIDTRLFDSLNKKEDNHNE